jgi:hypothetical protein
MERRERASRGWLIGILAGAALGIIVVANAFVITQLTLREIVVWRETGVTISPSQEWRMQLAWFWQDWWFLAGPLILVACCGGGILLGWFLARRFAGPEESLARVKPVE